MFKSATFKLTLWYLAILMIISLMFSMVVYRLAHDELYTGLSHQTQRIFNEYPVFNGDPTLVRRQNSDIEVGEHHILWRLGYFNLAVLVSAGFASYLLARRTLRPIEDAHERQKRFTADVSHELRTPLTSLKMTGEVTLMDPTATKGALRDALRSNVEDATVMEQLVNNLLRLTQLDTGTAQLNYTDMPASSIINAALAQVRRQQAAKQVTIKTSGDEIALHGDHDALAQLLVILLDNAIKYSPEQGIIELITDQRGATAHITIQDNGIGISAAALPHVFERFYRQDTARVSNEGFGLGLSIAKMIADRHNAVINVSSRSGKGTKVVIELPLAGLSNHDITAAKAPKKA